MSLPRKPSDTSDRSNTGPQRSAPRQPPSPPNGPSTLSSSGTRDHRLEHIIQNIYTKTAQLIVQARVQLGSYERRTSNASSSTTASNEQRTKTNRWFYISTQDIGFLRTELAFWRSHVTQAAAEEPPPPLYINIYLDVSTLSRSQALVWRYDRSRRMDIPISTERILLERWKLSLERPLPKTAVDLPNLYKRSIVFFRALYSFVRLLPGHELYRRLRQFGSGDGLSICYRMTSTPEDDNDHVLSLGTDRPLLQGDDMQSYEFSGIVTPMGTFRLQVQYRKDCDVVVEDTEQDLSTRMIGIDEHFFSPTMKTPTIEDAQRDEQQTQPVRRPSTDISDPQDTIQQRQRQANAGFRDPPFPGADSTDPSETSNHRFSTMERRASVPHASPFKSHSLSSSPQAGFYLSMGRPHSSVVTGERTAATVPQPRVQIETESAPSSRGGSSSSNSSSRIEFASSFDKIRDRNSPASTMTQRLSRTSDHGANVHLDTEDIADLREFMRLAATKPDLKMFQQNYGSGRVGDSSNASHATSQLSGNINHMLPSSEIKGIMFGSIHRSERSLSHFRALREMNNSLSESMSLSVSGDRQLRHGSTLNCSAANSAAGITTAAGMSFGSTSSSQGRSYMPAVPSPLHTENNSRVAVFQDRSLLERRSYLSDYAGEASGLQPAFSSYPQDRHHGGMQRLCYTIEGSSTSEPASSHNPESISSLLVTSATPCSSSAQATRLAAVEDDDSLVFRMSELGQEQFPSATDAGVTTTGMSATVPLSEYGWRLHSTALSEGQRVEPPLYENDGRRRSSGKNRKDGDYDTQSYKLL